MPSNRDIKTTVKPKHSKTNDVENQDTMHKSKDSFEEKIEEKPTCKTLFLLATEYFKYLYSIALVCFCVVLVMAGIFQKETSGTKEYNIHPGGALFLFWILIAWLAMMEGGQGCLVGLQPIDKKDYSATHPITLMNTRVAHRGDNMDRFIVGRQFLVVLVIFLINMCGSAVPGSDPLGLPNGVNAVFLGNGVALMITTIVLGQLTSQLNAAVCMLDFINNYFMLFTTYVSLFIEASGLLHAVYPVQMIFTKLSGQQIESFEEPPGLWKRTLFWGRVLFSTAILSFALAVTLEALVKGQSGMWEGVPVSVSVIIFFLLMCVVGLMDGMQIAAFALINMPEKELRTHKVAFSNCQLMFKGQNLQAFLIGRQVFVASLMFIVAKIATISIKEGEANIFGVSDGFQKFLDTGLLGAVVLTIIGSLIWRILASSLPLAFMSNPAIYIIIRICLLIEGIGICSAAWVFARIHKFLVRHRRDEVYLGIEDKFTESDTEEGSEEGYLFQLAVASTRNLSTRNMNLSTRNLSTRSVGVTKDLEAHSGLRMPILPPVSMKNFNVAMDGASQRNFDALCALSTRSAPAMNTLNMSTRMSIVEIKSMKGIKSTDGGKSMSMKNFNFSG